MSLNKISYIISDETCPYDNIALEEYLLKHVEPGECILYLWQNRKAVVIGYNQNPWEECRTEKLEKEDGYLARRLSGGGAVFHDLGNLNFTFLVREEDYSVERQAEVILRAVQSFGIPAVKNGRNDLAVDGKKFSGNAFYKTGLFCYHHGTIMVRVDKENVGRYLNVSQEKLRSKGVDSVKSRVANLTEYVPGLTVDDVKDALVRVFGEVYDLPVESFRTERIHEEELKAGIEKFASWEWQYGRRIPFQYEAGRKLPWGEILIQLDVVEGVVRQAAVWSDGLDTDFPRTAERLLAGTRYRSDEWDELPAMISDEREAEMMKDVIRCLKEDV